MTLPLPTAPAMSISTSTQWTAAAGSIGPNAPSPCNRNEHPPRRNLVVQTRTHVDVDVTWVHVHVCPRSRYVHADVKEGARGYMQTPAMQVVPFWHLVPHVPQFRLSVWTFTQKVPAA